MKPIMPYSARILLVALLSITPIVLGADQDEGAIPLQEKDKGNTTLPAKDTIAGKKAIDKGDQFVAGEETNLPDAPALQGKVLKAATTDKVKDKTQLKGKVKNKADFKDKNKAPAATKGDALKNQLDTTKETVDTELNKTNTKEGTLKKDEAAREGEVPSKTEPGKSDKGMPKKGAVPDIEVTPSKEEAAPQEKEIEPHFAVINPEDLPAGIRWSGINTGQEIALWAKHRGMTMEDDAEPVKDGVAGFIHKYGTSFSIKNLQWDRKYNLFFDFVRFGYYNGKKYPSELKIYAKNKNFGEECIGFLSYSKVKSIIGMYRVPIPYKFTVQGEVEIVLRELSPVKGFWGIWDMIITDAPDASATIFHKETLQDSGQDKMKDKDHIVDIP